MVVADLLKELYVLKNNVASGMDAAEAIANMDIPLADISEAELGSQAVDRTLGQPETAVDLILEAVRNNPRFQEQEVYPVNSKFYAKITDGSIARSGYTQGDGQYNSWTEVFPDGTPGFNDTTGGRTGDSENLLVDVNTIDSLPDDTIVRVEAFSYQNGTVYYYFDWEGLGTKATPYEIHTDPTSDDGLSWDRDNPPNAKDGKTTRYSNIDPVLNSGGGGGAGDFYLYHCTWTETADSEGHDRIVSDETNEWIFWDASVTCAGCC